MIQVQTRLEVADNSGARQVMCIKVLGGSKRRYAFVGDVIKVSIKAAMPRGKVKKGDVMNAVVVRTCKGVRRQDGSSIRYEDNAVVLLNNQREPIGTRIFRPCLQRITGKFYEDHIVSPRGFIKESFTMSMLKIKKDDNVIIITGKSKGMKGKVLRVLPNSKLIVEGINMVTKHEKPNPNKGIQGGKKI